MFYMVLFRLKGELPILLDYGMHFKDMEESLRNTVAKLNNNPIENLCYLPGLYVIPVGEGTIINASVVYGLPTELDFPILAYDHASDSYHYCHGPIDLPGWL